MGKIIAIAGKGGTGKSTISALITRGLREQAVGSILAIDADPNNNLGDLLGTGAESTMVDIVDDISKNPSQIPQSMSRDRYIDLKIQESIAEEKGFDLLSMGRPEGPGCYCSANNMLRELIRRLMENYSYIVVDNEAGMEHLSRRLIREIDTLFIVSDNTVVGVKSAARVSALADELNIKVVNRSLFLNKSKETSALLKEEIARNGLNLQAMLPFDEEIEEAAVKNRNVFELSDTNKTLALIKDALKLSITGRG